MKKTRRESGFAVLLVFAMAAAIALMLYMEMPRVAFEAQREREALLIERGEEYKRAIQLYFRKFKTYPISIDALENTNNIRFLRRRYPDPLTGKDDWRLIHIGPGGVFTDSLTNKPKSAQNTPNQNNFITEGPSLAGDAPTTDEQSGPAFRRRPSDGGQQQTGTDPNAQQPVTGTQPGPDQPPNDPNSPQNQAAQLGLGQNPAQPGTPAPGQQQPGAQPQPVSAFPGIPGVPFNPGAQQPGTAPTDPNAQGVSAANSGGFGQPGMGTGQPGSNAAADLIRGLLTQPRSMPGSQGLGGGSQITTGSIAGVASKVEKRGIKIYHERDKYNEWEFIYDFSKDRTGGGQLANMMGAGQAGQLQPGQQPTNTPFGGQSGMGSSFGLGSPTQQQQPTTPGMQAGPLPPPTSSPQQ